MEHITTKEAKQLMEYYNINPKVISLKTWQYALGVELEHGNKFGALTNISDDNLDLTCKIAIAHLLEFPDSYKRLRRMEKKADKYWTQFEKPKIFN